MGQSSQSVPTNQRAMGHHVAKHAHNTGPQIRIYNRPIGLSVFVDMAPNTIEKSKDRKCSDDIEHRYFVFTQPPK